MLPCTPCKTGGPFSKSAVVEVRTRRIPKSDVYESPLLNAMRNFQYCSALVDVRRQDEQKQTSDRVQ